MKMPSRLRRRAAGFTLIEIMVASSLVSVAMGMTLGTFLFCLRAMYRDNVRLETNASLRYFTAQMANETLESSEFYIFPDYAALDGSVDLNADTSALSTDAYGADIAHGDCVVLVTRTDVSSDALVRKFRIYFRVATTSGRANEAPIRYYESPDWGTAGTSSTLTTLLNAVNLRSNPAYAASGATNRQITARAKGRRIGSTSNHYPIFCSEAATVSPTNESFSINVEFITGTSANNMLSSSSFNYTVSPRR